MRGMDFPFCDKQEINKIRTELIFMNLIFMRLLKIGSIFMIFFYDLPNNCQSFLSVEIFCTFALKALIS